MMTMPNNVVQFNVETVHNKVKAYIKMMSRSSERTAEAYEADFRQFCQVALKKQLEELRTEDLAVSSTLINGYQDLLCDNYKGATVGRKMSAIKSIFAYLSADDNSPIRMEVFNVIKAPPKMTEKIGVLEKEEVDQMIELAKELPNGDQKSAIIWLAFQTGIRLNALINLKMSDIKNIKGVWVVTVYDKGNKLDEKPLPEGLYACLTGLTRSDDKVFTLTNRTAQRAVDELCERMNIPAERNISFHSLKKAGINYILETTGDIDLAAKFGNHKDVQTTYESYADRKKDFTAMPSYTMGQEIDTSALNDLTKEQLLEIINTCKDSTKIEILGKLCIK